MIFFWKVIVGQGLGFHKIIHTAILYSLLSIKVDSVVRATYQREN